MGVYTFGSIRTDPKIVKNTGFLDWDEFGDPRYAGFRWCYVSELPQHARHSEFILAFDVSNNPFKFEATAYQGQGMSKPLKNFGKNCPFMVERRWTEGGRSCRTFDFDHDKLKRYYESYISQFTNAAVAAARKNINAVQYAWEHTIFVPIPEFTTGRISISQIAKVDKLRNNEVIIRGGWATSSNLIIKQVTDSVTGNIISSALYHFDNNTQRIVFDSQFNGVDVIIDYEYDTIVLDPSCQTFTTPIDIGSLFNEKIKISDYPSIENGIGKADWDLSCLNKDLQLYDAQKNPQQTIEVLALGWSGPNTKPGVVVDSDIDGAHNGDIWTRYKDGILIGAWKDSPNIPLEDLAGNYNVMASLFQSSGSVDPVTGVACLRLMRPVATLPMEFSSDYWLGEWFYNYASQLDPNEAGIVFKIRKVANGIAPAFQQSIES